MGRLVVVSNRVADPRKAASGGLAVAVGQAMEASGGLWFGWSGKVIEDGTPGEGELRVQTAGMVQLATVDLSREDHDSYYLGYSNGVLWPVFHYRLDLADFDAGYVGGYRRVNQMMAHKLASLLRPDDIIWVHDYHLIPLAAELRVMGCGQRMGFFLHIPLPPPLILAAIPDHGWLIRSLFAYDLVGFQSKADVEHFSRYVGTEISARILGEHEFRAYGKTLQVRAFPIGIDVDEFETLGKGKDAQDLFNQMRSEFSRRRLLVGVERMDYSKGLPQRIKAFQLLLEELSGESGLSHADPDRSAQPGVGRCLRFVASGAGEPVWCHQWQLRGTGLDARARHPPQRGTQTPARPVPGGLCGAGNPLARRHEPGGQGVHRGAGPGRSGRADPVAFCRRRRAIARSLAGEPLRYGAHRRSHAARAANAAGRTPAAPSGLVAKDS